jgi:hypothetical protein
MRANSLLVTFPPWGPLPLVVRSFSKSGAEKAITEAPLTDRVLRVIMLR